MTPYEISLFLKIAFTESELQECLILEDTINKLVKNRMIKSDVKSNNGYSIDIKGVIYMSLVQSILPENINIPRSML